MNKKNKKEMKSNSKIINKESKTKMKNMIKESKSKFNFYSNNH